MNVGAGLESSPHQSSRRSPFPFAARMKRVLGRLFLYPILSPFVLTVHESINIPAFARALRDAGGNVAVVVWLCGDAFGDLAESREERETALFRRRAGEVQDRVALVKAQGG